MSIEIRPMASDDIDAVGDVVQAANDAEERAAGREPEPNTPEQTERFRIGTQRFIDRDGDGAWVALDDQGVVGMAEAIRRNDFWGLSMLFIHPRAQGQGIGRMLIDRTLDYAEGATQRMIMASEDPRALRRYSMAGLAIHPGVKAEGTLDRSLIPAGLPGREGGVDDIDLAVAVDAALGRDRSEDIAFLVEQKTSMEVLEDGVRRGFALHRDGRPVLLGASDDETAAILLWRMLAVHVKDRVELYCLTAGQDWAVRVALAARLSVTGSGPLFASGMAVPGPWLPSGWYF